MNVALGAPVGGQMMQTEPLLPRETTEVTVSTGLKGVGEAHVWCNMLCILNYGLNIAMIYFHSPSHFPAVA